MNTIQTQCPACRTIFDLSAGILTQAKGLVRCGSCQHVFKAQVFVEPVRKELDKAIEMPAVSESEVENIAPSKAENQTESRGSEAKTETQNSALGLPLYQLGEVSIYKPAHKPSVLQSQASIDAFGNLKRQTQAESIQLESIPAQAIQLEPIPAKSPVSQAAAPKGLDASEQSARAQTQSSAPFQKSVDAPNPSERMALGLATDLTKIPVQASLSPMPKSLLKEKSERLLELKTAKSKDQPKARISLLNLFLSFILFVLLLILVLSLAILFIPEFKALVVSYLPILPIYWKQFQLIMDVSALKNLFNL